MRKMTYVTNPQRRVVYISVKLKKYMKIEKAVEIEKILK